MSLIDDAKKAGLTEEEIEALRTAEADMEPDNEALRAIAGAEEESAAAPAADGAAPAPDKGGEAEPAQAAAEPGAAADDGAAAPASDAQTEPEPASERDRPHLQTYHADKVEDIDAQLKAIASEKATALKKLADGEIEATEYADIEHRLSTQQSDLVSKKTRAELSVEFNEQAQRSLLQHERSRFLRAAQKADGVDYKDAKLAATFDRALALVCSDPEFAGRGYDEIDTLFDRAHTMVMAMIGHKKPEAPARPAGEAQSQQLGSRATAAQQRPEKPREVPSTLSGLPTAAPATVEDATMEKIRTLEGDDLERFIAGLPKGEHERLLRTYS